MNNFGLIIISRLLVKTANKITWRLGRSYKCSVKMLDHARPLIRPGMVILTHKNFKFTNLFMDGYWSHAAIIVSEDHVVEATGKGVVKTEIEEFISSCDDFVVLKPTFCNEYNMKQAGEYAQKVIGCRYNFNFRPSKNAFYCSELVYWAYAKTCNWYDAKSSISSDINDFISGNPVQPQRIFDSRQMWALI